MTKGQMKPEGRCCAMAFCGVRASWNLDATGTWQSGMELEGLTHWRELPGLCNDSVFLRPFGEELFTNCEDAFRDEAAVMNHKSLVSETLGDRIVPSSRG